MTLFLCGVLFLIVGYFTYGRFLNHIVRPGDRPTPSVTHGDGIDFVPMPRWKNMLIELLNIAGIGPVIGAILGIRFGTAAFVIIPVGCVLMGAAHDFLIGMMSVRNDGLGIPGLLVNKSFGRWFAKSYSWFLVAMLFLVVTTFIVVPANIIDGSWLPGVSFFWPAVALIFAYYVIATLCPIDKIIGRVYPFVAIVLLLGTAAVAFELVRRGLARPELLNDCPGFADFKAQNPIFPCLFVTISCGLISGFHSTQAALMARTLKCERDGLPTFYGMMIAEGVIAMVWAAAALMIYNTDPANLALDPMHVFSNITGTMLGGWIGVVTVASIVVLAVTSGDTALRSTRLMVAELCGIDQKPIGRRALTTVPLVAIVGSMLAWAHLHPDSFDIIWNYFSWGNQTIASVSLMCVFSWLYRKQGPAASLVALVPGLFITTVVVTFILWSPGVNGHPHGLIPGGIPMGWSVGIGVACSLIFAYYAYACARSYEARKRAAGDGANR